MHTHARIHRGAPMAGIGCVFMFMYVHVRMWICGIFVFTYVHLGACLLVRRIFDIMQYGTYAHFFFVNFFFCKFLCIYAGETNV